ncbi:MAG: aminopeptidase [Anaerolineales bacterium]|nr:aminopeptidase [Anaerolineales bacterium]
MTDPRVTNLAKILVNYSTKVQPGDKVMIRGFPLQPVGAPLVREVYREVLLAGGLPITYIGLEGLRYIRLTYANEEQLQYVDPISKMSLEEFDVEIRITATTNSQELSNVDPANYELVTRSYAELMQVFMERSAKGELRWVATRYPTKAFAQDAEMSLVEFEDFFYRITFADLDDPIEAWKEVSRKQQGIIQWLKGKDHVELRGPNADLEFRIGDRPFINCDGDANMPDGEIFTAPIEDSINGWIRFGYTALNGGVGVEGVELHFENGKVVSASAEKNEDFLLKILDTDKGARYVGEFGIGTNDMIDRYTKIGLFDEKTGGTIHLALGGGYPESGSKNKSAIHWDMICDMRDGGEIIVDNELLYRSGKFQV